MDDKLIVVVFDNEKQAYEGSRPSRICMPRAVSRSMRAP